MFLVPILKFLTAYFAPVLTYISELWLWSNPTQVWKIAFGAIIVLMFDFFMNIHPFLLNVCLQMRLEPFPRYRLLVHLFELLAGKRETI